MIEHLESRRCDTSLYKGLALTPTTATFPLWNLSGQLVGFQQYTPNAPKQAKKPSEGRYWTIFNQKNCQTAFGLDVLGSKSKPLYLVEGAFDACPLHNLEENCLATLSNNPQHLKMWLRSLGYYTIALCEGDKAGRMLSKVADEAIYLPDGKDIGDLTYKQIKEII